MVWKNKQSHALVVGLKLPKFMQSNGFTVVLVVVIVAVVVKSKMVGIGVMGCVVVWVAFLL